MNYDGIEKGYILIWRKIENSWVAKNPKLFRLWLHLLLEATHKPFKTIFNGQVITLNPGELVTGLKKIAKRTGLTERNIRTGLLLFEKLGKTTSKTTNAGRHITICNYASYQNGNLSNDIQTDKPATNDRQLYNTHNTHNTHNSLQKNREIADKLDLEDNTSAENSHYQQMIKLQNTEIVRMSQFYPELKNAKLNEMRLSQTNDQALRQQFFEPVGDLTGNGYALKELQALLVHCNYISAFPRGKPYNYTKNLILELLDDGHRFQLLINQIWETHKYEGKIETMSIEKIFSREIKMTRRITT